MDITEALTIMDLHAATANSLTPKSVQRQYRKLALKRHPDKNGNTAESCTSFQELGDAYGIVIKMVDTDNDDYCFDGDAPNTDPGVAYFDILKQFLKSTLDVSSYDDAMCDKIKEIISNCQNLSMTLFENMDRDTSVTVYQFLSAYKHILYISDDVLGQVKAIIQNKFEELLIYTIVPTLDDLLKDNVYKLLIDDEVYLVPLWHKEMYFENRTLHGKEILVICQPELTDDYSIDDDNNLTVVRDIPFTSALLASDTVEICVFTKRFHIHTANMSLARTQTLRLQRQGILCINDANMYNNIDRGDVFISVRFV